jgi:hypothetical protein
MANADMGLEKLGQQIRAEQTVRPLFVAREQEDFGVLSDVGGRGEAVAGESHFKASYGLADLGTVKLGEALDGGDYSDGEAAPGDDEFPLLVVEGFEGGDLAFEAKVSALKGDGVLGFGGLPAPERSAPGAELADLADVAGEASLVVLDSS